MRLVPYKLRITRATRLGAPRAPVANDDGFELGFDGGAQGRDFC